MPDLRDTRARLDRAERYIEGLEASIAAWYAEEPYPHRARLDPQAEMGISIGDQFTVYASLLRQPPDGWGLVVGDVVNDLRFALDYLAYQLVVTETGEDPPPNPRSIQFPIVLYRDRYFETDKRGQLTSNSGAYRISRASRRAQEFVESIQPYNAGDDACWLWVLSELCNINKHRLIHTTPAILDSTELRYRLLAGELPAGSTVEAFQVDHLKDGAPLYAVTFGTFAPGTKIGIETRLFTYIAFEPGPPAHGSNLTSTLRSLHALVDWTYKELRAEVER